jgi:hypothetical protein
MNIAQALNECEGSFPWNIPDSGKVVRVPGKDEKQVG